MPRQKTRSDRVRRQAKTSPLNRPRRDPTSGRITGAAFAPDQSSTATGIAQVFPGSGRPPAATQAPPASAQAPVAPRPSAATVTVTSSPWCRLPDGLMAATHPDPDRPGVPVTLTRSPSRIIAARTGASGLPR
jgi:hypothetical protein